MYDVIRLNAYKKDDQKSGLDIYVLKMFILFFETYLKKENVIKKKNIYVSNAAKFLLIIGDVLIRHTTLYSADTGFGKPRPVLEIRYWFWEA